MVYFKEVQRFNQWWMWAIILPSVALMIGLCMHNIYSWTVLGKVPNSDNLSLEWRIVIVCLAMVATVGAAYTIFIATLETNIKNNSLYYRFKPFIFRWRKISKNDIQSWEVRKYDPIGEYGGWGIRLTLSNGKAYNVKGDQGLQLHLKSGKKMLIGTQKPEELKQVMDEMMNEKQVNYG